jgi:hypothetical protein
MISFCSQCSGWVLTLVYEPKFCARYGAAIARSIPILGYLVLLIVAVAVVWVIAK